MIQRALRQASVVAITIIRLTVTGWLLLGGHGCSGSGPAPVECPDDYPAACPDGGATFAAEVAPLVHGRCTICHGSGQQPPLLQSYANIRAAASVIHLQLTHCPPLMPKPPSPPLTADERRVIFSWLACGATDN